MRTLFRLYILVRVRELDQGVFQTVCSAGQGPCRSSLVFHRYLCATGSEIEQFDTSVRPKDELNVTRTCLTVSREGFSLEYTKCEC